MALLARTVAVALVMTSFGRGLTNINWSEVAVSLKIKTTIAIYGA